MHHLKVLLLLSLGLSLVVAPGIPFALAQQPRYGGTFIQVVEGEPATLNRYLGGGTDNLPMTSQIYNFLVRIDAYGKAEPDLAWAWEISSDGLTYTFRLVRNATWHDGKPFTSADAKFSLETFVPNSPRRFWWAHVSSVETPDDYTLVIKMKRSYAPLMFVLGTGNSSPYPLPKHVWEGKDIKTNPANLQPIGTGPFKFKEWVKGSHVEVVRNDKYFKKGLPYLDRIVFKFIPDSNTALLALEKGEVDYIHFLNIAPQEIGRLKANPKLLITPLGGGGLGALELFMLNLRHPILQKLPVRQAIAHAIDKQLVTEKGTAGHGKIADSMLHSDVFGWSTDVPKYPYDPAKAERLLEQAGYPKGSDGVRFRLRLSAFAGRAYDQISAEVIRDNLRKVGIAVEAILTDRTTWLDTVYSKWDFDTFVNLRSSGPDPEDGIPVYLHSKQIIKASFTNAMGYSNKDVDALLEAQASEPDVKKRAQMWHEIQVKTLTDLPLVPLFEIPVANVYNAQFRDLIIDYSMVGSRERAWWTGGVPAVATPTPTPPATVTATVTARPVTTTVTAPAVTNTITSPALTQTVTAQPRATAPAAQGAFPSEFIAAAVFSVIVVGAGAFYAGRRTRKIT